MLDGHVRAVLQHLPIRLPENIHRLLHDRQVEGLHVCVVREVNVRVPARVLSEPPKTESSPVPPRVLGGPV